MAISTYKTFLMHKSGSSWSKLVDITDFPDLGGEPEVLDTTTLSNGMKTSIAGIQETEALKFTANYTADDYNTIKALEGVNGEYAVWFGGTESDGTLTPDGSEGKFSWKGDIRVFVNGGGVNEVVKMTISALPSSDIVPATA